MEVLIPTIANNPQITSRVSIFSPTYSATSWRKKNPFRFHVPNSKFPLYPPFPLYLPLSNSNKFQISAHFGRPANRRNSLRKKLTEQRQKVRPNPIIYFPSSNFQNPVDKFHDIDNFQSNLDSDRVKQRSIKSNSEVVEDIVESDGIKSNSGVVGHIMESDSVKKSKSELLGESVLLNQLESWVDQYKADSEFWGVGSGPIFTVFQDSDGKVERVVVNEDEILRRSRIEPSLYKRSELEDLTEVNSKISHARFLAREIETGNNVLPINSSVVKFVVSSGQSSVFNAIRSVTLRPGLFSKLSRVGIAVVCGLFVFWALKKLFTAGEDRVEYSRLEKEMMRRKIKARSEKEKLLKGSVEVIQDSKELQIMYSERPQLDKEDLMNKVVKAKASNEKLVLHKSSDTHAIKSRDFNNKIQEIRAMARHARELERTDPLPSDRDGEDDQNVNKLSSDKDVIQHPVEGSLSSPTDFHNGYSGKTIGISETIKPTSLDDSKGVDAGFFGEVALIQNSDTQNSDIIKMEVPNDGESMKRDVKDREYGSKLSDTIEVGQSSETPDTQSCKIKENSGRPKPRVILSVKEAREYLSQNRDKREQNIVPQARTVQEVDTVLSMPSEKETDGNTSQGNKNDKMFEISVSNGIPDCTYATKASADNPPERKESVPTKNLDPEPAEEMIDLQIPRAKGTVPTRKNDPEDIEEGYGVINHQMPTTSLDLGSTGRIAEAAPSVNKENWLEKNFHKVEPIVKKIGVGFRDNYMVAREKANQELVLNPEMIQPESVEDDSELDWMKDDKLREIVFQVRENELTGRDPFYLMDAEDKLAFFDGLEKKVEKENEKLVNLHRWIHSNVENLDYGADGISLNDSPEKIIPRWKGPPVDASPEFINDYVEQRKALVAESLRNPYLVKLDGQGSLQNSEESPSHESTASTSEVYSQNTIVQDGDLKTPKTVIEGSDGSVRSGKKSGKEYWQHTKKWSREFLESYNAETDPEMKAVMKDIGKDLDRWITEKEIQESAELINKIPERGRRFIEEKLNKFKREMELFGPQAVVSKYSEYAEEKEEDYLWWLDLPFVLCIELYTNQEGDQEIGFYSLEMAADLELDPKQYHLIAFEDAGDCKNLCYIIQAHMEMLCNGNAFVVAQPPKDAFREAKANGFSVTVIRKGELQLNVDQTLEEVEEQIIEIGSKMYHDKIMRKRSVDISSLMKGVFGTRKPIKRKRSKRKLKKPTKH